MGNMGTGRGSDSPLPKRLISLVVDAGLGPAAMHGLDKIIRALREKGMAVQRETNRWLHRRLWVSLPLPPGRPGTMKPASTAASLMMPSNASFAGGAVWCAQGSTSLGHRGDGARMRSVTHFVADQSMLLTSQFEPATTDKARYGKFHSIRHLLCSTKAKQTACLSDQVGLIQAESALYADESSFR